MKKIIAILAFLLTIMPLALLLTGCETAENPSDLSNPANGSENSSENSDSVPEDKEDEPTSIIGLDGKPVYRSEITRIYVYNDELEEVVVDTLDSEEHLFIECDGMCYLSEPWGKSHTSIDNPELYDGKMSFTDMDGEVFTTEYKKLKVGDEICGLTVKDAHTLLTDDSCNITAKFGGEITLTGYININPENDYMVNVGMIYFIIDDKSAVLPGIFSMTYSQVPEYVNEISRNGFFLAGGDEPEFVWSRNEYGIISLGNEEDTTVDLTGIDREHGYYSKAKITVDDIELTSSGGNMYRYSARLVDLEIIG